MADPIRLGDIGEMASTLVVFTSDGHEYGFYFADERPDYELDPTVNLYRDDEEEPIATIHLNPQAPCVDKTHVIVRPSSFAESVSKIWNDNLK